MRYITRKRAMNPFDQVLEFRCIVCGQLVSEKVHVCRKDARKIKLLPLKEIKAFPGNTKKIFSKRRR